MIVNIKSEGEVYTSNNQKAFGFEVNGKAFKALFSDIYTNKPGSIVREIGSNCRDAHIAANKGDVPFKIVVHKDPISESYIEFIDYGTGMDSETIEKLYTSFFSSTKDKDNEQIGGFGIGSKSPLSYSDSFNVTSIKDGYKNIALITKVDNLPQYKLMVKDYPTEEENSTSVKIPIRGSDCEIFLKEIYTQFRYIDVRPIVEANFENPHIFPDYIFESSKIKVERRKESMLPGMNLNIGGIAYPFLKNLRYTNNALMGFSYAISLPIGMVEMSLSREHISYNSETRAKILEIFDSAKNDFVQFMSERAKDKDFVRKNAREYLTIVNNGSAISKGFDASILDDVNAAFGIRTPADIVQRIISCKTGDTRLYGNAFNTRDNLRSIIISIMSSIIGYKMKELIIVCDYNDEDDEKILTRKVHKAIISNTQDRIWILYIKDRCHVDQIAEAVSTIVNVKVTTPYTFYEDLGIEKPKPKRAVSRNRKIVELDPMQYKSHLNFDKDKLNFEAFDENDYIFVGPIKQSYSDTPIRDSFPLLEKILPGKRITTIKHRNAKTIVKALQDGSPNANILHVEDSDMLVEKMAEVVIPNVSKEVRISTVLKLFKEHTAIGREGYIIEGWPARHYLVAGYVSEYLVGPNKILKEDVLQALNEISEEYKDVLPIEVKRGTILSKVFLDNTAQEFIELVSEKINSKYPGILDIKNVYDFYKKNVKLNGN